MSLTDDVVRSLEIIQMTLFREGRPNLDSLAALNCLVTREDRIKNLPQHLWDEYESYLIIHKDAGMPPTSEPNGRARIWSQQHSS